MTLRLFSHLIVSCQSFASTRPSPIMYAMQAAPAMMRPVSCSAPSVDILPLATSMPVTNAATVTQNFLDVSFLTMSFHVIITLSFPGHPARHRQYSIQSLSHTGHSMECSAMYLRNTAVMYQSPCSSSKYRCETVMSASTASG